jgi:nucleotide-binding universal stress UspA family protein
MFKSILASLTGFASDKSVLDAAFAIARNNSGHVACLHTRIDPTESAALAGVTSRHMHSSLLEIAQRIAGEEAERSGQVNAAFTEAITRHSMSISDDPAHDKGASASLKEVTTLLDETLHQSRYHDLTVMARVPELSSERLHNIVMQAGRPVLIAPPKPAQTIGETVVIAWKDGAEAAKALTSAMPILALAKRVTIVSLSENNTGNDIDVASAEKVALQLKWHGIAAKVQMFYASTVSASRKIEEIAFSLDADLLVMGAYGHSRMREMIFGGVTLEMLGDCAIPVLMMH